MRFLIYTDPHWSQYSSIVRKRGTNYSARLENLINSINWAEDLAVQKGCVSIICLGDFFDRPELNAEEISALKEVKWANMSHLFLAGNHELGLNNHKYSSAHLFNLCNQAQVIDSITAWNADSTQFVFIPYILEGDRLDLKEYLKEANNKPHSKRVIFSHNDIQGIQYGGYLSKVGFSIDEIEENCNLFLNGHLHNGTKVTDKIYNLGNLTGQNFSEDAEQYKHSAFIFDTDSFRLEEFENPFALNFYKLEAMNVSSLNKIRLKQNSVVTIKCKQKNQSLVKEWINNTQNIIESRIIIEPEISVATDDIAEALTVDHLEKFREFILETLGSTEVVNQELAEVLK